MSCRFIAFFIAVRPAIHGSKKIGILIAGAVPLLLAVGVRPSAAWSQDVLERPLKTFTLLWENDSVTGSDRDYSNGLKLTWSQPYIPTANDRFSLKDWTFRHLPFMRYPDTPRATAFSIGQYIYTPKDTDRSDLILEDRPYAGYSFVGFGFISRTGSRRDVWELEIGMVGPWSLAENTQNAFHDLIGTRHAQGWAHQLDNEPGLEAIYESKWQLGRMGPWHGLGMDIIPHIGAQIGNIATSAKVGIELRFGWYIPRDFGTCPIRPGCDSGYALDNGAADAAERSKLGFHFFAAAEGRAILRDIFLDGSTFKKSHRVDKEILVADLMGGIALTYGRLKASYALILRTPEFKQREDNHAFGAISVSYAY